VNVLVTVALALVVYVAGFAFFKIKERWSGAAGSCPNRAGWAAFAAAPGSVAVDRPDHARRVGQGVAQHPTRTGASRKGAEQR
jgi:hypothetical protein